MTRDDVLASAHRPARLLSMPLAAVLLFVLVFAACWPIIGSEFSLWDDHEQLAVNQFLNPPLLKGLGKRWIAPYMNIYIPIPHTVWYLLAHVAQPPDDAPMRYLHAWPFKLTNVVVHAATAVVVFLCLAKLFPKRWPALLGACVFALHPVQVECLGWASGLKDLLMGFFSCLCILFYLGDPRRGLELSSRAYGAAVLCMLLACLSKPTAMVVPAMLLVIDLFIARRPLEATFTRLVPFGLMAAACAYAARYVQPVHDFGVPLTPSDRLLIPFHTFAFYLYKLVWPTQLAFDYGQNWFLLAGSSRLYWAWTAPAAVAATAAALWRKMPLLAVGLVLAVIPLLPVSGLVFFDYSYYSINADHYLYLPMLGVALVIATLLDRVTIRTGLFVSVPVLVALGALTTRQALTWGTQASQVRHNLTVNPQSFSSYAMLGIVEMNNARGDMEKLRAAEVYVRKAVAIRPDHPRSLNMLANVLSAQGRHEEALEQIDAAIRESPFDPQYHLARAGILGSLKRGAESIEALRQVLKQDPDHLLANELVNAWDDLRKHGVKPPPPPATRPATGPVTRPAATGDVEKPANP